MLRSILTLVAAFAALLATPVAAQDFPALSGRVVDEANIIDAATEVELVQKLEALEAQSQRQLVIATIPDLQGYDIADYGYQLGREWGIGDAERNDGVLLLVASTIYILLTPWKELALVRHHPIVVHRRVAHVDADGIDTVALADVDQRPRGCVQCLVPADFLPLHVIVCRHDFLDRPAQPVRILVNVAQGYGLGADMPAAKRVILVALDGEYVVTISLNDQAADSFTKVAGAVVGLA